jgi:hypothetical protein
MQQFFQMYVVFYNPQINESAILHHSIISGTGAAITAVVIARWKGR